jgi:hypothetical protein
LRRKAVSRLASQRSHRQCAALAKAIVACEPRHSIALLHSNQRRKTFM